MIVENTDEVTFRIFFQETSLKIEGLPTLINPRLRVKPDIKNKLYKEEIQFYYKEILIAFENSN